jgi:hypothetical protein
MKPTAAKKSVAKKAPTKPAARPAARKPSARSKPNPAYKREEYVSFEEHRRWNSAGITDDGDVPLRPRTLKGWGVGGNAKSPGKKETNRKPVQPRRPITAKPKPKTKPKRVQDGWI